MSSGQLKFIGLGIGNYYTWNDQNHQHATGLYKSVSMHLSKETE